MSTLHPPRLASALMRWMGPRDDALIGDLLEAYRTGRSDRWYWRQVFAAIVIGTVTAVRSHKFLAIRAIALGWCVVWLYLNFVGSSVWWAVRTAFNFSEFLFVTGLTDWFYVHHVHFPATVLQNGPSMLTPSVGMFASGWLVGYCHRAHGASMTLVYCASLPLPTVIAVLWQIAEHGRYAGPPLLSVAAFLFPMVYLPALVGGLWAARPRHQSAPIAR